MTLRLGNWTYDRTRRPKTSKPHSLSGMTNLFSAVSAYAVPASARPCDEGLENGRVHVKHVTRDVRSTDDSKCGARAPNF